MQPSADVCLWGPKLRGARKYLGGSPNAGADALFGVPSHSRVVLRLDLATGAVSSLPGKTQRGPFKWLRGVLAPDGSIFCIPACAGCVLRIRPDGSLSTLGKGVIPRGDWMWHGAAVGSDGNIYCIPACAERVLMIDPSTDTVSLIGPALHPGLDAKWYGGIKAADGAIWGMPYNAPSALKIVPETGEVKEVGSFGAGKWKWHGGTRCGEYIIGIPSHADAVLRVHTRTDEISLLPTGLTGGYKFGGGVNDGLGSVWAVPSDCMYTLKIDAAAGRVTRVGPCGDEKNKWQNGVVGRDGRVYCIPCNASTVLCIEPKAGALSLVGELGDTKHKFQGAYASSDGTIWGLPENCEHVLRILPPTRAQVDAGHGDSAAEAIEATAAAVDAVADVTAVDVVSVAATLCGSPLLPPAAAASSAAAAGEAAVAPVGRGDRSGGQAARLRMESVEALRLVCSRQRGCAPALSLSCAALLHALVSDAAVRAADPVSPTSPSCKLLRLRKRLAAEWLDFSSTHYEAVKRASVGSLASTVGERADASRRMRGELGCATRTEAMPQGAFAPREAHASYVRRNLSSRASSLSSLLLLDVLPQALKPAERRAAVSHYAPIAEARRRLLLSRSECRVLALGAGPGFEAVALATLADFLG